MHRCPCPPRLYLFYYHPNTYLFLFYFIQISFIFLPVFLFFILLSPFAFASPSPRMPSPSPHPPPPHQPSPLAESGKTKGESQQQPPTSSSLAMRVQRNLLSKFSSRGVVRMLANHRVISLMDTLFALLSEFYDQQIAEKVVKNAIKLIFKVGLLEREQKLNEAQLQLLGGAERELCQLALTIQSFRAVQFSYDQPFFLDALNRLQHCVLTIIDQTLSEKSAVRASTVFAHLCDGNFLDTIFTSAEEKYAKLMSRFGEEMEVLMLCNSGGDGNIPR